MSAELNEIKVLLAEISGEIALSEERIKNKVEKTEFLEKMQELKEEVMPVIRKVDKRIDGLYIKVTGASGILVTIIELIARLV